MKDSAPETPLSEAPKSRWTLSGFHGKARVSTIFGELPIEALRRRDELKTPSGRYLRVEWVDQIHLDEDYLSGNPGAQPVLVRQGALGRHVPKKDFIISPAQTLLIAGRGKPRSGRDLEGMHPGILHRPVKAITYYLFHCGEPVPVLVEGVWCPTTP